MWYTTKLNIFSSCIVVERRTKFYDHYSRPSRCRSGRGRGSRGDHPDATYGVSNGLLPLGRDPIFAHPKSLYPNPARSSLYGASNPSHSACTSLLLQKGHLRSKDLYRAPPRALPSSCPKDQTAARSSLSAWPQSRRSSRGRYWSRTGMSGSRDTILRLVRQSHQSTRSEPRIIGLDDWAWKRRMRYGTLICDLERGLPIDLLPDRTVETVSAWLQDHPSIEVVSRDGSSEYASAIRKGAPQARVVSDRWHLVKNLAACVSVQLAKTLAQLRRAEAAKQRGSGQMGEPSSRRERRGQTRAIAQTQLARQDERMARYEHILELQKQGMKSAKIAQTLGVTPRTIQRWIATGDIPYSRPRKQRPRLIDPYQTYILERLQQGCHNKAQLERELRAKGYKGSGRAMYRYLETLEPIGFSPDDSASITRQAASIQPHPLLTLSASQATWLFFRRPEDLEPEEQETLRQVRQASPHLEAAYQLVDAFLQM